MLVRACRAAFQLRPSGPPLPSSSWTANCRSLHASASQLKAVPVQQLRDEAIRTRFIRIVGDGGTGGLGPVEARDRVLARIDRSKNWLMLVDEQALDPELAAQRGLSLGTTVGICRIMNKKEVFQKAKERSAASKQKKQSNKREEKEFQFTWGVAVNDLQHKLKRAQQVLDKGGRTALVITSPKSSKPPQLNDRRMFIDMLKEQLGFGAGKATIWKPEEWRGSKTAIYLEGVRQAGAVPSAELPSSY